MSSSQSMPHCPIVVVGAGLSGWAVIDALRAKTDTAITLITADNANRYHKPMLSSGFGQSKSPESLVRAKGADACQAANVNLLDFCIVTAIDADTKTLTYQKNNQSHTLGFDYLILATGATPIYPNGVDRTLATDLNHLDGYRTIYQMIERHGQASKPCHIAVIGAGMVGVEIAEDLANAGVSVSLVDTHAYPLASLLPAVAGERFVAALMRIGIDYINHTRPTSTCKDNEQIKLSLDNGKALLCDGVIVATGLGFDSQLAKSAGIECSTHGILVDENLQTSVQGIFALGDCIVVGGVPCRFVAPHRTQGATIAGAITGSPVPYKHTTPMIRLKNKSLSIQATGNAFAKTDWQQVSDEEGKLVMNKVQDGQEIATLTVVQKTA